MQIFFALDAMIAMGLFLFAWIAMNLICRISLPLIVTSAIPPIDHCRLFLQAMSPHHSAWPVTKRKPESLLQRTQDIKGLRVSTVIRENIHQPLLAMTAMACRMPSQSILATATASNVMVMLIY
jgi:hypothetical protein